MQDSEIDYGNQLPEREEENELLPAVCCDCHFDHFHSSNFENRIGVKKVVN